MEDSPTGSHVLCGLGEGIRPYSSGYFRGGFPTSTGCWDCCYRLFSPDTNGERLLTVSWIHFQWGFDSGLCFVSATTENLSEFLGPAKEKRGLEVRFCLRWRSLSKAFVHEWSRICSEVDSVSMWCGKELSQKAIPVDASLRRRFRSVEPGGGFLNWPGNTLVFPQKSWWRQLGRGKSEPLCLSYYPHDLNMDKWKLMDGWVLFFHTKESNLALRGRLQGTESRMQVPDAGSASSTMTNGLSSSVTTRRCWASSGGLRNGP